MKKIGILFATICMIFLFAVSASAKEVVDSGECGAQGDNVAWVLYDDGELVIRGSGEIKYNAFYNNDYIIKVTIEEGVTVIGSDAFAECDSIVSVSLANSVTLIDSHSFAWCDSLSYINFPKNLVRINEGAFLFAKFLKVAIPENLEFIADTAFGYCENIESFEVNDNNNYYSNDEHGVLFNKDKTLLIKYPSKSKNTEYHIPQSVKRINIEAFYSCKALKEIAIPISIKNIFSDTFKYTYIDFIIYEGNKEQWNNINVVPNGNECIINAKIHTMDHRIENRLSEANCITPKKNIEFCIDCNEEISENVVDNQLGKHTTTNGKCDNCKAFIVEQGMSIELQCATNSEGSWVDTTDVFNIIETGKSTVSVGGYYSCTHYATIKALKTGEAYLYLVASNNAILSQSKIIVIEHTHNYTLLTKEATCTTTGTKTYTCTCGDTYTETIPATNHPNATTDAGKAPTATEVGYTAGKYCPDCKTWIEGHVEIPKLDEHKHTYTSTVTKEATCWREGETTHTCTCGDSYTETIAKLDHEYRPWETKKKPTCTVPGLEWSYCLICDNDFEREIPAEGHNEYEYTRRATPAEAGAYVVACDKCWIEFSSISFGRPAEYKLSNTKYTYDGKTKTPKLTVVTSDGKVLTKGVDYTVELPEDRKSVGIHTYRVVFEGDYLGETKVSYQILPSKTSKITATQSTDTIKLTWKKVTGADGYRVYQYNSKTGKYKTLKTLTGTSYTVKNLKAGTSYKFAVKAYTKDSGETLWAASSKTITTCTKPATPTVKVTAGAGKATLSWSKVTGATGYVVYMQDEFGDYVKVGSTTKTSYTKKSLKKGKTYKFRLKAYKKVDGKYIYSGYKTYSVKVK